MWKLKRYLKPYWKAALAAPLFMLLEVYMDLLQPKLMASIVDQGVMQDNLPHIIQTGIWMIAIALIGWCGGIGCTLYSSTASQSFGADLRSDLFQKVQSFSFRNLDRLPTGTLVTRLTNDVVQLQTMVQMTLRILVRSPFLTIGSLAMAFTISARLAMILVAVLPVLFIALIWLIRYASPLYSKVQQRLDSVNTVVQENLSGIRAVKSFARFGYETKRFGKTNDDYTEMAVKATRWVAVNMPLTTLMLNGAIVAVLWFGGPRVWEGSLQPGELIAFINYVTQILFSLGMVSMILISISRSKVSADRVNEVLETAPEITDSPRTKEHPIRAGRIQFNNVSFSYGPNQKKVLHGISFTAESGQTVAVLGGTGSGKTTLVYLIPRLYDADEGTITIDGTDVKDIKLRHLKERIAVVLQESLLFTGTIRDNIRFGRPSAAQEEVEAAARDAQAHDFIMQMPLGYDTLLGQKGINLSGGQKQRISIARALLVQPSILIMDDSTSAVDLTTEAWIQQALRNRLGGCTRIIIAQRISSVQDADKIIVLEDGQIVAEGTHSELLKVSPVYLEIYRSQSGKEETRYA